MESTSVVSVRSEEFCEMLGIEDDKDIKSVYVSFSPMMDEWSFIIDFYEETDEPN